MLKFRELTIEDKAWFDDMLSGCSYGILEYNFTTVFIWRKMTNLRIADTQDCIILSTGAERPSFLYPYGKCSGIEAVERIVAHCRENGIVPRLHSVMPCMRKELEEAYPGKWTYTLNRDAGDYIYETESLMTLKGKKLSSKRNHINRFEQAYPDWSYEKITKENIDEAYDMNLKWCSLMDCQNAPGLREEACAVKIAFKNFFDLKLDGGLLRANGKVVAFSMGERLDDNTYLVHIEKAFADVNGAYPMINKQFVINNASGYKYVNREDDAGDEGLRRAKLSYRPAIIAEKYNAEYIGD